MTGSNLVAVLIKPALPKTKVVWGIESAYVDPSQYDWFERSVARLAVSLSRFPDLIIFNSHAGRDYHLAAGLSGSRAVVIRNGIDTRCFAPDTKSGSRLRASWQVAEGALLIGVVGRLDPMKDHRTFLRAARIFAQIRPEARFVCIGGGPDGYSRELCAFAEQLELADKVLWSGFVHDMSSAYNALDICCSSSYGEGTSNAVAEAMACGVPCVVTNVGDSAFIVGETGIVVPPKDAAALATGWAAMTERLAEAPQLRGAARERIESRLSLPSLIRNTTETLLGLL